MGTWQELAEKMAGIFQVPVDLVKATVEAETSGRNVTGDDGNALGYGQVWASKWHYDDLQDTVKRLGLSISLPSQNDLPGLTSLILGNDELSMGLAANVIGDYWNAANGNFVNFLKGYVGPKVSNAEIARRKAIYAKYGGNADGGGGITIPSFEDKRYMGWFIMGVGVLLIIKALGGDTAKVREVAESA